MRLDIRNHARNGALAFMMLAASGCAAPPDGRTNTKTDSAEALNANDGAAYQYFVSKGLLDFQAAAIVGNLDQESNVDPGAVQPDGPGRGIAQWSVGGRWDSDANDNLVSYAAQHGQSPGSLSVQLDFIWYELETFPGYGLGDLRASSSLSQAVIAFQNEFEGCGQCEQSTRIQYAQAVLNAFGGGGGGGGGGGDCGVHADHRLYCTNRVTPMYQNPWSESPVVDTLRSSYSWFTCWWAGELHAGGNHTWYWTQGDDNGAWGFVPAVAVNTPDDFDTSALEHGLPQCGQ